MSSPLSTVSGGSPNLRWCDVSRLLLIFCCCCAQRVTADVLVYMQQQIHRQIEAEFKDLPADFGGTIPPQGIKALVVYASPDPMGCTTINPPPANTSLHGPHWAVLISQGDCMFEKKIRLAQASQYDIAIVHSYNSSILVHMEADNPEGIGIPSVFIGAAAGDLMKKYYQYDKGYYIIIDDSDSPFDFANLLIPFAVVVAICFLTMIGFMVVKCIKDRRRERRHRLPSSSLKKIPTTKFRKKTDPYETCAICLDDFVEGEKLRILPCSHAYHCKCIDPWLTRNKRVCPMCKRRVFAEDEQARSDTDSSSDFDDRTPLLGSAGNSTSGGTFRASRQHLIERMMASRQNTGVQGLPELPNPFSSSSTSSSPTSSLTESGNSFESAGSSRAEVHRTADSSATEVHHSSSAPVDSFIERIIAQNIEERNARIASLCDAISRTEYPTDRDDTLGNA